MTRLLTCGYETGDVNEAGFSVIGANTPITAVNTSPTPRAGGAYCLRIGPPTSSANLNVTTKTFTLPASKTEAWIRFGFYIHPVSASELVIAQALDAGGVAVNSLTWDATSGVVRLRLGAGTGSALLATGTGFTADAWHLIEVREQFTSITVGVTEVWVDGTQVINFSGDNVAAVASASMQSLVLGVMAIQNSATGMYLAYDDIAINDTAGTRNNGRVGEGRVVLLTPNGAGSNTGLTRGGTDTGANWSQVSETPPSLTQFVYSATAGLRDTYALTDLPTNVQAINVAEVIALGQNSDAGGGSLGLTVKSGATTNEGTAQPQTQTPAYVRQQYETDPATSAAWTTTGLNALEAGVTVR